MMTFHQETGLWLLGTLLAVLLLQFAEERKHLHPPKDFFTNPTKYNHP